MAVLKGLILTVSTLQGFGALEKTEFNSFYFAEGVVVLKGTDLTVSTLGRCGRVLTVGCGSLETTDFNSFYFGNGVAVLK